MVLRLSSLKGDSSTLVQILNEADCISRSANTHGKGMNATILPLAVGHGTNINSNPTVGVTYTGHCQYHITLSLQTRRISRRRAAQFELEVLRNLNLCTTVGTMKHLYSETLLIYTASFVDRLAQYFLKYCDSYRLKKRLFPQSISRSNLLW